MDWDKRIRLAKKSWDDSRIRLAKKSWNDSRIRLAKKFDSRIRLAKKDNVDSGKKYVLVIYLSTNLSYLTNR